ncbi:uncharacterized protein LOC144119595 [Amblyomma americanum]
MAAWSREGSHTSLSELSRRWSSSRPEVQSRHTSGLLGYLMPFYLCPVLYPGTKESKCFYCVLLMMSWWMLRAMPKAVVAFLPAIVLPLLGIMGPEQVASSYLSVDVLTAALLLWLVLVGDETLTIRRLSYALVGRFGGRARPVLALLTAATFVASLVLPQSLVAVVVTCLAERVCNFVHDEGLQDPQRCLESAVANDEWAGRPSCEVDTLLLYEELAVALWKRHRAGLRDPDPEEYCGVSDKPADGPDSRLLNAAALRRKASILKHPTRIIGATSPRRISMLTSNDDSTPRTAPSVRTSGPRFAKLPAEDQRQPEAKQQSGDHKPSGKLIRAKRRRQSFADKPHVFRDSERRHVPQDQLPEENGSQSSFVSPWSQPPTRAVFAHQPRRIALAAPRASADSTVAGGAGPPHPLPRGGAKPFSPMSTLSPNSRPPLTGSRASIGSAGSSYDSMVQAAHATPRLRAQLEASLRPVAGGGRAAITGPVLPAPQPEEGGGRRPLGARQPRILIRHQNQVVLPGRESPKRAGEFQRFRGRDRSFVTAVLSSLHSKPPDNEDEDPEELRLQRHQKVLAALCMCGNMTSVAGSIASYWFMPAAEAIAAVMDSSSLSFWSWTLITLPVSLAASALSSVCVYYGSLHASDNQLNAQAERIICCYAKLRLNRLEKYKQHTDYYRRIQLKKELSDATQRSPF